PGKIFGHLREIAACRGRRIGAELAEQRTQTVVDVRKAAGNALHLGGRTGDVSVRHGKVGKDEFGRVVDLGEIDRIDLCRYGRQYGALFRGSSPLAAPADETRADLIGQPVTGEAPEALAVDDLDRALGRPVEEDRAIVP